MLYDVLASYNLSSITSGSILESVMTLFAENYQYLIEITARQILRFLGSTP